MCATAAALVLDRIPALRGLAGLHAPMTVESVPFLLACGYLTFRILYPVHLVAARAMEREADREMVKLTADPDGCIEAMTAIFTILGAPRLHVPPAAPAVRHASVRRRAAQLLPPHRRLVCRTPGGPGSREPRLTIINPGSDSRTGTTDVPQHRRACGTAGVGRDRRVGRNGRRRAGPQGRTERRRRAGPQGRTGLRRARDAWRRVPQSRRERWVAHRYPREVLSKSPISPGGLAGRLRIEAAYPL
jgi:hypothetical protein